MKVILIKLSQTNFFLVHKVFTNSFICYFDEYSYELLYDQFHEYKLVNENEIKLEEAIISEYQRLSYGYNMVYFE